MKERLTIEKRLRSVERDIMWNQHAFIESRDQAQKARVKERLERLEAQRQQLKTRLAL